ncbi:MAG: hypothetical protein AB7F86_20570 [Bdellovibrionales bacterium]
MEMTEAEQSIRASRRQKAEEAWTHYWKPIDSLCKTEAVLEKRVLDKSPNDLARARGMRYYFIESLKTRVADRLERRAQDIKAGDKIALECSGDKKKIIQ